MVHFSPLVRVPVGAPAHTHTFSNCVYFGNPHMRPSFTAGYDLCQPRLLRILERCVSLRDMGPDYTYYGIASPWLHVSQCY